MKAYATISDCLAEVPALTAGGDKRREIEAALQSALLDASRIFESETGVYEGFYLPASKDFAVRSYRTDGTRFLPVHPLAEIESIEGFAGEKFNLDEVRYNGRYLVFPNVICGCGNFGDTVKVKARFGFDCIPNDIKLAVKSYAVLSFLSLPMNRANVDTNLGERDEARLRQTYNRILKVWQAKLAYLQSGLG